MATIRRAALTVLAFTLAVGCGKQETPVDQSRANETKPLDAELAETPASNATSTPGGETSIMPSAPDAVVKDKLAKSQTDTTPNAEAKEKITLKPVDMKEFEAFIAEHKGKVVLVDCWASWCPPCIEKLPKFLETAKSNAGDAYVFATLNFDVDDDQIENAISILEEHQATGTNLRMTTHQSEFEKALGYEGLPHYLVYDKAGELILKTQKFEEAKEKLSQAAN